MFAQAEHKKTAQDLGIHSPLNPAHAPQSPSPILSPRGMRTEVVTKKKRKQTKAPSGHAVTDARCSGQAQTTTTGAESHGLKRRANRTTRPSAPEECGLRQVQKKKAKQIKAPSGHAVRDAHCSGQAQTTTTVAESHGLKRRANRNTRPYPP